MPRSGCEGSSPTARSAPVSGRRRRKRAPRGSPPPSSARVTAAGWKASQRFEFPPENPWWLRLSKGPDHRFSRWHRQARLIRVEVQLYSWPTETRPNQAQAEEGRSHNAALGPCADRVAFERVWARGADQAEGDHETDCRRPAATTNPSVGEHGHRLVAADLGDDVLLLGHAGAGEFDAAGNMIPKKQGRRRTNIVTFSSLTFLKALGAS